ncbi:glycosylphosphatidylinositol anchor biosynthesis, partial [Xylographa soralifera]|nr:glycosylphosphatidylinositol anchor biosynthesis [Xylographa soralifera]
MSSTAGPDLATSVGSSAGGTSSDHKGLRQRALRRAQHAVTSRDVFLFLIAFRILNALSIKTFFQPDEYFQSLEPAWQIAFGPDSGAWITWEWKHHLRSAIHPYLFAAIYKLSAALAKLLHLSAHNRAELLIAAPKVLQAISAATGDFYTWQLAQKVYGSDSNESWVT